jgi:hypothetical protein
MSRAPKVLEMGANGLSCHVKGLVNYGHCEMARRGQDDPLPVISGATENLQRENLWSKYKNFSVLEKIRDFLPKLFHITEWLRNPSLTCSLPFIYTDLKWF